LIRFGHDGWLGQLARDVTFESVEAAARAAGHVMVRDNPGHARLVVGYDRRFLSDAFSRAIARDLAAFGIDIWLISTPVSTPVLSFAIGLVDALGGIMVTGGSNPADVNGLRLRGPDGGALPRWMLDVVEDLAQEPGSIGHIGPTGAVAELDPMLDYLDSLAADLPIKTIRTSGITVAIDSMWGTSSELLPELIDGDGSRSVEIRTAHNPLFPDLSSPRPVLENLDRLRRIVRTGDAAAGFALSADGCNLGLLDENGAYVPPGMLNALVAWYLLMVERRTGTLARTITSSTSIDYIANAANVLLHEMPVGHTSTCETIREHMPLMLGDPGGGIVLSDHLFERDSVLTALTLVSCLVRTGMAMSEIVEDVKSITGERYLERFHITLTPEQVDLVQIRLAREEWPLEIAGQSVREFYITDGVKFEMQNECWLLIRYDEIDGVLQIVAEAIEQDVSSQLIKAGRDMMFV
jgi:phosphomannomutase